MSTESPNARRVFLSYARPDLVVAKQLHADLLRAGQKPWIDIHDLLPGVRWEDEITRQINNSDYVILLLSQNSVDRRGFVQKEVRLALSEAERMPPNAIYIIPAKIDSCEISYQALRAIHWADLHSSWHDGVNAILKAIGAQPLFRKDLWLPSKIDIVIREQHLYQTFQRWRTLPDGYLSVIEHFDEGEEIYILWNVKDALLEKYTREGVRYYGPYRPKREELIAICGLLGLNDFACDVVD